MFVKFSKQQHTERRQMHINKRTCGKLFLSAFTNAVLFGDQSLSVSRDVQTCPDTAPSSQSV